MILVALGFAVLVGTTVSSCSSMLAGLSRSGFFSHHLLHFRKNAARSPNVPLIAYFMTSLQALIDGQLQLGYMGESK